tara:strand:- start:38 stop:679 length:642 start_codon:yes stop_codon:yes gene_type:complete
MKKFLIIGGNSDIGIKLHESLRKKNIKTILTYNKKKPNYKDSFFLNLENFRSIDLFIKKLSKKYKVLDGIIIMASHQPKLMNFSKILKSDFDKHLKLNVYGMHKILSQLIKKFLNKENDPIIFSLLSKSMGDSKTYALKNFGAYTVGKYGLLGILKLIETEFRWIKIKTIYPSYTNTKMLKIFDYRFIDLLKRKKKISEIDNVVKVILKKLKV